MTTETNQPNNAFHKHNKEFNWLANACKSILVHMVFHCDGADVKQTGVTWAMCAVPGVRQTKLSPDSVWGFMDGSVSCK